MPCSERNGRILHGKAVAEYKRNGTGESGRVGGSSRNLETADASCSAGRKGYYEVPLMWENRLQSLYFHEDERHEITALTVFLNGGPVMVKTCRPLLK